MLEGMRRLDKEFSDCEASVAKAAEDAKKMIEQGMGKLNRQSSKALKIITSTEDKHLKRKVLFQQQEQAVVAKEQALANRRSEEHTLNSSHITRSRMPSSACSPLLVDALAK